MKKFILILLLAVNLLASGAEQMLAAEQASTKERTLTEKLLFKPSKDLTDDELKQRVLYTNLIGVGVSMAWGTAFWDYFTISPVTADEGWFAEDTKYGGADKLGHVYATYIFSLGFSSLYEYWGMDNNDAILYGPLTAWVFQGMMEVGDSFSPTQGFAYEDIVMNTLGAIFYTVREKYPSVKEKLDLRLEYLPDFQEGDEDIFTQYNSKKYLLTLKFSGFESMESNFMKYGELQVGYYTRGYRHEDLYEQNERTAYVGIGINVSEVFASMGWTKTSKFFNYVQLPYSYVPFGYDFNSESYVAPYSRPYHGYKK